MKFSVEMRKIDDHMHEFDKLISVSNTAVMLLEMSTVERKEVVPYIQVMYPDFKEYYGSSIISNENIVDRIKTIFSKTLHIIKIVLREMIALLGKIIFFWKKNGTDPISKFVGSVDADADDIIKHTREHCPDIGTIRDRANVCGLMSDRLFEIANDIRSNPLTFDKTAEQLITAAFNHHAGGHDYNSNLGITATAAHTIHVEDILKTKANIKALAHVTSLFSVNNLTLGFNLFHNGGKQRCLDAYGKLLAAAKNLSNYIDELEHKYKSVVGGGHAAVVPQGHQFSEEETEYVNKIKQFNHVINSFRWVQKGYSSLSQINHDLFRLDKYLKERNVMCERFNKKHGMKG